MRYLRWWTLLKKINLGYILIGMGPTKLQNWDTV